MSRATYAEEALEKLASLVEDWCEDTVRGKEHDWPMPEVTAFSNATVKRLRSLRDKKLARAEGLFLAEGLRIIAEARDSGRLPEIIAFSAEGARHPLAAGIIAATEAAGGEAIETTPDILSKMSGKDNPQMLLGAYRQPDIVARADRPEQSAAVDRRPSAARPRQYRHHPAGPATPPGPAG